METAEWSEQCQCGKAIYGTSDVPDIIPVVLPLTSPLNESNRKQLFSQQKLRLMARPLFPFVYCSTSYLVASFNKQTTWSRVLLEKLQFLS